MKQVAQKLNILKMNAAERATYSHYMKIIHNDRDEIEYALAKGMAKGREAGIVEGREEGRVMGIEEGRAEGEYIKTIQIAKNLLSQGLDINTISFATGLSVLEIENLK